MKPCPRNDSKERSLWAPGYLNHIHSCSQGRLRIPTSPERWPYIIVLLWDKNRKHEARVLCLSSCLALGVRPQASFCLLWAPVSSSVNWEKSPFVMLRTSNEEMKWDGLYKGEELFHSSFIDWQTYVLWMSSRKRWSWISAFNSG